MRTVMAICIIMLAIDVYQILIYQQLVPILLWTNDTLFIDYQAEQSLYAACKHRWRSM